jgi:hypothetical protein
MGNYLFLYLKTGGGHLAPVKAVAEEIKTKKRVDDGPVLDYILKYQ